MSIDVDPLVAPPPQEVPLTNAPLARVIVQLRFPEVLSIEQREFVAPFQETLRTEYPVLRQEQTQGILLGTAGMTPVKPQTAWRLGHTDGHWRVSLTPVFLALETTHYVSRADLLSRLEKVTHALNEHVQPAQLDRLGVRYINRISGEAVNDVAKLVRAEVRGIAGTIAATHATHALSESMFELPHARLLARWGYLPPGATVDPAAIEPTEEKSWILDLDMFSATSMAFSVDGVLQETERYAQRIYTLFHWAVTKDFRVRYGGLP